MMITPNSTLGRHLDNVSIVYLFKDHTSLMALSLETHC